MSGHQPDCTVETSRPKTKTLANILEEEVSFDLAFQCNLCKGSVEACLCVERHTEHAWGDIHPSPYVTLFV